MTNNRRRLVGRVISNKMQKTVVVAIERRKLHPVYKKVVGSLKKVMAHDESDQVKVGSLVRIVESRPLSKNKRWVVEQVLEEIRSELIEHKSAQEELREQLGEDQGGQ
ncbi:MAG: 30S ribosomal protein S17 [Chloroflexi bacterium]|nr:30S ribosomal protein S17 [Chloroflexota bacterium]